MLGGRTATVKLHLAAYALAGDGHVEPAVAIFDRLEKIYPDRPEILATRASAMLAVGDENRALADVTRAIALGEAVGHYPDRLQAFRNLRDMLTSSNSANE